jgi:hypothetical protein
MKEYLSGIVCGRALALCLALMTACSGGSRGASAGPGRADASDAGDAAGEEKPDAANVTDATVGHDTGLPSDGSLPTDVSTDVTADSSVDAPVDSFADTIVAPPTDASTDGDATSPSAADSATDSSSSPDSSASDTGSGLPADSGGSVACTQGETRCQGTQPQTCASSGVWQASGYPCGASQTCNNGACQSAATTVTIPGCNAPSYAQLPGNGNALFVGREQNAQLSSPPACTGTSSWHLVLSTMDWSASPPSLSITNHALFATPSPGVTIASGQTIFTAYDATVMSYGGEEWVAFECAFSGGQTVSSCVGPLVETGSPSSWYVDPARTTVVVSGTSINSASVPKLLVFQGTPYLYYTTVTFSNGSWTGAPTRGVQLQESSGANGNVIWPAGMTSAVSALGAATVEVFSLDPLDPISSGYADGSGVYTDGTYVYMLAGLGGDVSNGCVLASGGLNPNVAGCYRMAVGRASTPLAVHGFNEYRIPEYLLPDNASQYPRVVVDGSGELEVMGSFYTTPTNVPAALPSLPQPTANSWTQFLFPFDPSSQTYGLTYAQWSDGNFQMASNTTSLGATYWLAYQGDGNFVMYDYYDNPLWDIGKSTAGYCPGSSCTFIFQSDGNLVAYHNGVSYWASETNNVGQGLRFTSTPLYPYHAMIWNSAQAPIWQQ